MSVTVLSLGAGVQSSTLLMMADRGELEHKVDFAIFADTGNEPKEVYEWLDYLKRITRNIPIYVVSNGNIVNDVLNAWENKTRCDAPPFFTLGEDNKKGIIRRHCTTYYKISAIKKGIREILGVPKFKHVKQDVHMLIGISTDEIQRVKPSRDKWITNHHPLIDMDIDREACLAYFEKHRLPLPPKSSCIICPYHSDAMWKHIKDTSPEEFEEACLFDEKIRNHPTLDSKMYLHASRKPLREVSFSDDDDRVVDSFNNECEGMCGI